MVGFDQVTEFVHDDIVDAGLGGVDQLQVERDFAGSGAAAPA